MMKSTSNLSAFILLSFFVSLILACGGGEEVLSEHEQRVMDADSIKTYYEVAEDAVEEMKDIQEQLQSHFDGLENPDSTLAALVIALNQDIAVQEGLIEKHRILIKQHKDYIKEHEDTALSAEKITLYHQQIANDFVSIKKDLLQIEDALYQAKSKASAFLSEDVGVVFLKK